MIRQESSPTDFAAALCRARRESGLSQRRLARAACLAVSTITRLESGERRPSRETVASLVAGFGWGESTDAERQARVRLYLAAGLVPDGHVVTGLRKVADVAPLRGRAVG